ncbi:MAG: alkaline phosphatase family protein [Pirellulales bacterium]
MRRREFVKLVATSAGATLLTSCGGTAGESPPSGRRVLVVAFDGLDPRILRSLMATGRLPNFSRLAQVGSFQQIATSTPPHTPVAFSSIISGTDPGTHQIFDFIHRDPKPDTNAPLRPYFSTAEADSSEHQRAISLGGWRLPLSGGGVRLLRQGKSFWDYLVARGIDTDIYYLPANYPPQSPQGPGRFRAISGMGTPDLLGTYGEFTLFTPDAPRRGRTVGGGRFAYLELVGDRGSAELIGPPNFLRQPGASGEAEPMKAAIEIVRDRTNAFARIRISGQTVLLKEGEWSDWIPVEFATGVPGTTMLKATGAPTSVWGMVRLYAKQVHPKFELYVSPVNIDPLRPANPITVPASFSGELARRYGRFHTLGIPEDTKALSHGALGEDEFLAQARSGMKERRKQFRGVLADFRRGCLFFYFGASDLVQHMFWRDRDPEHPGRVPEQAERYSGVVDDVYVEADQVVGEALSASRAGDTLLVMSDHGFTTFRRGFNLNTWLLQQAFIKPQPGNWQGANHLLVNVDWSKTRAYGLGMNGVYVNLAGREKHGIVKAAAKRSVLGEIRDKLMEARDINGTPMIRRVDLVEDLYPRADPSIAPDLIVGYNDGYRASWETVLGEMPRELVVDNLDRWSGEHLIAAELVPGILLTNRKIAVDEPTIRDIAPTILAAFDIPLPAEMTGQNLFASSEHVLNETDQDRQGIV